MLLDALDYHQVADDPAPIYMGELPRRWEEIPARVVVNLCGVYPQGEPYGRVVHGLALLDVLDPDLLPERRAFETFLDAVHQHAGSEPTYWHCHAGLNRSGIALAAYLHRFRGQPISHAIDALRSRRTRMVLCNSLFERTLRRWYGTPEEQDFDPLSFEDYLTERGGLRDQDY